MGRFLLCWLAIFGQWVHAAETEAGAAPEAVAGPCSKACGAGLCVSDDKGDYCDCANAGPGYVGDLCIVFQTNYYSTTFTGTLNIDSTQFDKDDFTEALAINLKVHTERMRVVYFEPVGAETSIQLEILPSDSVTTGMPARFTSYGAGMKLMRLWNDGEGKGDIFNRPVLPYTFTTLQSTELPLSAPAIVGIVIGVLVFVGCCFLCCKFEWYKCLSNPERRPKALRALPAAHLPSRPKSLAKFGAPGKFGRGPPNRPPPGAAAPGRFVPLGPSGRGPPSGPPPGRGPPSGRGPPPGPPPGRAPAAPAIYGYL